MIDLRDYQRLIDQGPPELPPMFPDWSEFQARGEAAARRGILE